MGAALVLPNWGSGENPDQYDQWGYKAGFGLAGAPQYKWSQNYIDGFPDFKHMTDKGYMPTCGQNQDVMQLFGTSVYKLRKNGNDMKLAAPNNQFYAWDAATVQTGAPGYLYNPSASELAPWWPDRTGADGKGQPYSDPTKSHTKTCNPLTFPNCDLSGMREKAPVVIRYGEGSKGYSSGAIESELYSWKQNDPEEQRIFVMDRWVKAISDSYAHYAGGHTDPALYEVNTQDTSAYDPCGRPGIIEKLLPLLTAGISVWIFHKFVLGMIPLPMPLPAQSALQGGFFFTGLALGKYMNAETPEQNQDYRNMAAYSITLAGGFAAGATLANYYDYGENLQWYAGAIGGLGMTFAFQPMIAYTIGPALFGINLVYAVAKFIVGGVSYWICRVANWGLSACIDYDAFPDARRWDFPSVVALMTDKAIAEEGWTREDPRSEFVYRSLLTNPYLSQMVTADGDLPGIYGNEHNIPVNPIGEMVQVTANCTDKQSDGVNWFWGFGGKPVGMVWTPAEEMSWNGKTESGFSKTSTNQWACQNWDIISCEEPSGDKTAGNCPEPDGYQNPQQKAENFKFRTTMRRWIDGALTAAKDPANLAKMNLVSGLDGRSYKEPKETCAKFLQTCQYDLQYGGFDDINERGNYAFDNLTQLLYEVEGGCAGLADEPKLLVNTLFRYPNSSAAWDEMETWGYGWKHDDGTPTSNKIAAAHYLHQGSQDILKAPNQSSSLINWLSPVDERIAALRNIPDPGFKPIPATNAKGPISINDKTELQKKLHSVALFVWNADSLMNAMSGASWLEAAQANAAPDDFGIIFACWAMYSAFTKGVPSIVEKCSYGMKDVNGAALILAWQNNPPILPDPAEQGFFMYYAALMLNKFARAGLGWDVYQWRDSEDGQCFNAKTFIADTLETGKHLSPERTYLDPIGVDGTPILKILPFGDQPPDTKPEKLLLRTLQDPNEGMYPTRPVGERPIFKPIEDPNEGLQPTKPVSEDPGLRGLLPRILKILPLPWQPAPPRKVDPPNSTLKPLQFPHLLEPTHAPTFQNYISGWVAYYLANSGPQAGAITPCGNVRNMANFAFYGDQDTPIPAATWQYFITDNELDYHDVGRFLAIYQIGQLMSYNPHDSMETTVGAIWYYITLAQPANPAQTKLVACACLNFLRTDPGIETIMTPGAMSSIQQLLASQNC